MKKRIQFLQILGALLLVGLGFGCEKEHFKNPDRYAGAYSMTGMVRERFELSWDSVPVLGSGEVVVDEQGQLEFLRPGYDEGVTLQCNSKGELSAPGDDQVLGKINRDGFHFVYGFDSPIDTRFEIDLNGVRLAD